MTFQIQVFKQIFLSPVEFDFLVYLCLFLFFSFPYVVVKMSK